MYIFCCGMKRSGSTVQYLLTKDIAESTGKGKAVGYFSPKDYDSFIQLSQQYKNQYSYIVIKTHHFPHGLTSLFDNGEAKAIFVYRDLRDTIVSKMNKNSNIKFDDLTFLGEVLERRIKKYNAWMRVDDIMTSKYEVMVENLSQEALRIGEHLGIEVSNSFADHLANKYSLERQKKEIAEFDYEKHGYKHKDVCYIHPETLLHSNHIHSGYWGQWRTVLSPRQITFIEEQACDWLKSHGYPLNSELKNP